MCREEMLGEYGTLFEIVLAANSDVLVHHVELSHSYRQKIVLCLHANDLVSIQMIKIDLLHF